MNEDELDATEVNESSPTRTFPIIAIGAGEGGIVAVSELLQHLPLDTGFAYIYIQLPEKGMAGNLKSDLDTLTEMPVLYAEEGMALSPNRLYILPQDKDLVVLNNTFKKDQNKEKDFAHFPINRFFIALADHYEAKAIGILLSGSTTDGVLGLKSIKQAGGLTFSQNDSAQFTTMPITAFAEGAADLSLSPKELTEELVSIGRKKDLFFKAVNELNEELLANNDEDLLKLLRMLYGAVGVDFSLYKMSTIKRRIIRRMMLYKMESLKEYVEYLKQNGSEIHFLYQDLLINVTSFFRDQATSDYLLEHLLPKLVHAKVGNEPIRIWVPACSTGQEAYSLAMLVMEALGENTSNIAVQIFATDLSETAIAKARIGDYSKDEMVGISARRLQRFFNRHDGHFRVIKSLRDMCVFAHHNIIKDPPFSRLDIISCCNLMIYLDNPLQKKLLATFHNSLNNHGILLLGKSETVGSSSYLFTLVDKKVRIYLKKKEARPQVQFDIGNLTLARGQALPSKIQGQQKTKSDEAELDRIVDTLLLKKFTPASVVVNYNLDILLFRGATGLYLEPSPGKASLNLMKMAKSGLGFELKNAVHKAKKSGEAAKKEGLEVAVGNKVQRVSVEAVPLKTDSEEEYYLVVFEEIKQLKDDKDFGKLKDRRVKQLEAELTALREDMRSIVETQEAVNEELQSANEEIVSSNEELQSINEELETSKEEIESSNEELITINQELQLRNDQLAESHEYSEAVFTFMRESLVILDKDLRVKKANQAFYKTFQVQEEDTEGQLFFDLGNRQWNLPQLREALHHLQEQHTDFIGFEVRHPFPFIGEKVMLVNGRKIHQQQGQPLVLIAIEDITQYRQAERIIAERELWFRNMADNSPVMIWVTGNDRLCNFVNKTYLDFRNLALEEVIGKSWIEGAHPDDVERCHAIYNKSFSQREPFELIYRLQYKDGGYRQIISKGKPNITSDGGFTGFIGTCMEVDDQIRAEIKA